MTYRIVDCTGLSVLWEGTDKTTANLKLAYARRESPWMGYRIEESE